MTVSMTENLGSKWTYPSDHLPVGVTLKGKEYISVVSWNVLNSMWIGHIDNENDPQGLRESSIVTLHSVKCGDYTEREMRVAEKIIEFLTKSADILCLQECSRKMLELITERVNTVFFERFRIVSSNPKFNDVGVIIYDACKFYKPKLRVSHGVYTDDKDHYIMDAIFSIRSDKKLLRVVNTHIPGGETSSGGSQFVNYLFREWDPKLTTLLVGDMNQADGRIRQMISMIFSCNYTLPCESSLATSHQNAPFEYVSTSYYSHINTKKMPVNFDQIYIYKTKKNKLQYESIPLRQLDEEASDLVKKIEYNK